MFMKFGDAMRLAGVTNMLIAESGFEKISEAVGPESKSLRGTKFYTWDQVAKCTATVPSQKGLQGGLHKKKKDFGFQAQLKKNSVTWLERAK